MNRRDLLLNEMNIPQWVLRNPQVLKGDAMLCLSEAVKLVIISPQNYSDTALFRDILLALELDGSAVQWFDVEQAQRLTINHSPTLWLIEKTAQADSFAKKFADLTAWHTENWQDLCQSAHKRQLWQQIQTFLATHRQTYD